MRSCADGKPTFEEVEDIIKAYTFVKHRTDREAWKEGLMKEKVRALIFSVISRSTPILFRSGLFMHSKRLGETIPTKTLPPCILHWWLSALSWSETGTSARFQWIIQM